MSYGDQQACLPVIVTAGDGGVEGLATTPREHSLSYHSFRPCARKKGESFLHVNQSLCLTIKKFAFATDGPASTLMRRNWLSVLRLDWKQIEKISLEPREKVENLVSKYASLFEEGLGAIEEVTPHLKLK